MKKYWFLIGFIFIANWVFADCFIEGSAYFITLEAAKVKEILGLTSEETSDCEKYNEVVSVLKDKYTIDIENEIKSVCLFVFPRGRISDYAVVINGDFDTEKMQNSIKKAIDSGKWRYHKIETMKIGGVNYSAFRIDELINFIYFDKNTIVISSDFILKKENIKLSNLPDSISKKVQTTNNYLYGDKVFFSRLKSFFKFPDMELEKAKSLFCYIKDDKLFLEAEFNDSATSKDVLSKIENLSREQIDKFKKNVKEYFKRTNKQLTEENYNFTPDTFELIFHSLFFNKSIGLISNVNFNQKDNYLVISCDYNLNFASSLITAYTYKLIEDAKENKIKTKCNNNSYSVDMAIKKYNREHDVKMTTIDIKTLLNEKYLSKEPKMPSPECELYFMDSGSIACKKHEKY